MLLLLHRLCNGCLSYGWNFIGWVVVIGVCLDSVTLCKSVSRLDVLARNATMTHCKLCGGAGSLYGLACMQFGRYYGCKGSCASIRLGLGSIYLQLVVNAYGCGLIMQQVMHGKLRGGGHPVQVQTFGLQTFSMQHQLPFMLSAHNILNLNWEFV